MKGTLVNALTVIIGSSIGLLVGNKFKEKYRDIIFQAIGLFTILVGTNMLVKGTSLIPIFLALIFGAITGEGLRLDMRLNSLTEKFKSKVSKNTPRFTEGFITATLIFCVGAMTIVGSVQEGLTGDPTILYTKSIMDGITSLTLASGLGMGVIFSSISVLVIQGSLTLLGSQLQFLTKEIYLSNVTSLGGILIIALGFEILGIKKIKVLNLLPSLIYLPIFIFLFSKLGLL